MRCLPPGSAAINYFETAFPEVMPFGTKGAFHNKAEWIVDLTTKVPIPGFLPRASPAMTLKPFGMFQDA